MDERDDVRTELSDDEQALQAQLLQAREKLDGLVRDLHRIDGELEDLSTERQQYRLLQQVCRGLQELSEQGAAGLFWGAEATARAEDHLSLAWGRVDAFEKRLSEIEDRRRAVEWSLERLTREIPVVQP